VNDECLVLECPWSLFFDGSICTKGCGIGCVMISPSGVIHELAVRLEFACTINQAEYEALVAGLEWLMDMKVKHVHAWGDSRLVVQQVCGKSQCLEGALYCYRENVGSRSRSSTPFT
jgi:ribonuclease HI